ncbi:unnamed protein product [Calypogeia fissa]
MARPQDFARLPGTLLQRTWVGEKTDAYTEPVKTTLSGTQARSLSGRFGSLDVWTPALELGLYRTGYQTIVQNGSACFKLQQTNLFLFGAFHRASPRHAVVIREESSGWKTVNEDTDSSRGGVTETDEETMTSKPRRSVGLERRRAAKRAASQSVRRDACWQYRAV